MYLNPDELSKESLELNSKLRLFQIYKKLKHVSLKNDTYFQVYEDVFNKYVDKKITLVEIGVLNGGSLYMWKEYFGKNARIIGIDLNPDAKRLEKDGFEIFIGSQSDENFWDNFLSKVGEIDILIDDGGHENDQLIITLNKVIPKIKNDGLIVIEDTHTSYSKKFGNPSKYSFINYSKYLIDIINSRFPDSGIKKSNNFKNKIYSISFFESMVIINIHSKKSIRTSLIKSNFHDDKHIHDFRTYDYFPKISKYINNDFPILHRLPVIKKVIRKLFFTHNFIVKIINYFKLRKYFK